MKPNVPSILLYFVFPLLCFSDDDAEMWEDDAVEYVRKKIGALRECGSRRRICVDRSRVADPMEDFRSPQNAASILLTTLVRDRASQTLPQVLEVISNAVKRCVVRAGLIDELLTQQAVFQNPTASWKLHRKKRHGKRTVL